MTKSLEHWSETFQDLTFSGRTLTNITYDNCTFKGCDFSDATFDHCKFVDCEFTDSNLSLVNMAYSSLVDVLFQGCKLVGIDWTKVRWPLHIFSSPIKFNECIINDSSFFGLTLPEIVLEACKAHNVDFREGDFSQGNFQYTDFTDSIFGRTNLTEADFAEAINYDIDVLNNIIKHATFSQFEALRLLSSLDIKLVDC